jgi:hypothetical protein
MLSTISPQEPGSWYGDSAFCIALAAPTPAAASIAVQLRLVHARRAGVFIVARAEAAPTVSRS